MQYRASNSLEDSMYHKKREAAYLTSNSVEDPLYCHKKEPKYVGNNSVDNPIYCQKKDTRYLSSASAEVSSKENSCCSRELSPVRWCDQEVHGVFLNRSGWVQVQQKSLDESRKASYGNSGTNYVTRKSNENRSKHQSRETFRNYNGDVQVTKESRRKPEKLINNNNNCNNMGFYVNNDDLSSKLNKTRPLYLSLNSDFKTISQNPSPADGPLESPPSITPIISPPPAFQDIKQPRPIKPSITVQHHGNLRNSPSNSVVTVNTKSQSRMKPTVLRQNTVSRSFEEQPSQERRARFVQKCIESSSSSSGSLGFRSLDGSTTRVMPSLAETTDSSVGYDEDGDEEDCNSSSIACPVPIRYNRRSPMSEAFGVSSPDSSTSSSTMSPRPSSRERQTKGRPTRRIK